MPHAPRLSRANGLIGQPHRPTVICDHRAPWQGMVQFHERQDRFDSQGAVAVMEENLARTIALAQKLQETNVQLATDTNYLSRIASQERQPRWEDEAALAK